MSRLFRLASLAFLSSILSLSSALANDSAPVPATRTHELAIQTAPGQFIQNLGDSAIKIIADKQMEVDKRSESFSQILG